MTRSFLSQLRRFAHDREGNVLLIVALAVVPLFGMIGLAVDFGLTATEEAKLNQAADAAAIAGITAAQNYILAYTGNGNPNTAALAAAQTAAQAQFNANMGRVPNGATVTPSIGFSISGTTINGSVGYSFTMPTYFAKMLGRSTLTVNHTATSSLTMKTYANIYIVLDVSESMGIGATTADQNTIYNATKNINGGCVLACHYDSYANRQNAGTSLTSEQIAHNAGATLRIDVAKSAIASALTALQATNVNNSYQVAIYTFSNVLQNVYPLSSNIAGAITAASNIDMTSAWNGWGSSSSQGPIAGGTNITQALQSLNAALPAVGSGSVATAPLGYVMLITDAIQDNIEVVDQYGDGATDSNFSLYAPNSGFPFNSYTWYLQGMDPSQCAPIKTKGYTMMTLDVTYVIPAASQQTSASNPYFPSMFSYTQNHLLSNVATSMTSCASSTANYYSANTPTEISSAVSSMFNFAQAATSRLTQ